MEGEGTAKASREEAATAVAWRGQHSLTLTGLRAGRCCIRTPILMTTPKARPPGAYFLVRFSRGHLHLARMTPRGFTHIGDLVLHLGGYWSSH